MRQLDFSKGYINESKKEPEMINEFLGTLLICGVLGVVGSTAVLNVWKNISNLHTELIKLRRERMEAKSAKMKAKLEREQAKREYYLTKAGFSKEQIKSILSDDDTKEKDDNKENDANVKELRGLLKKKEDDLSPRERERLEELSDKVDPKDLSPKEQKALKAITGKSLTGNDTDQLTDDEKAEMDKKAAELKAQRDKSLKQMMAYENAIKTLPDGAEKDKHLKNLNDMVSIMNGSGSADAIKSLEKAAKEELSPEAQKLVDQVENSVDKISDTDFQKWKDEKGLTDDGLAKTADNIAQKDQKLLGAPQESERVKAANKKYDEAIAEWDKKIGEGNDIMNQAATETDPKKREELIQKGKDKLAECEAARKNADDALKDIHIAGLEDEVDNHTKECENLEKEYKNFWDNADPNDPDWEKNCKEYEEKITAARKKVDDAKSALDKARQEKQADNEKPADGEKQDEPAKKDGEGKDDEEGEESDDLKVGDQRTDNDDDLDDEEWGMTKDRKLSISNNQDPRKVFKQRTYKRGNKTFRTKSYYSKKGISITKDEYRERVAAWEKRNKKQSEKEPKKESFIGTPWTMTRLCESRPTLEAKQDNTFENICKDRLVYIKYVMDTTSDTTEKSQMKQMYDAIYNCCFDKNGKVRTMEDLYKYLDQTMIENKGEIPGLPTNDQVMNIDKKCKAWKELSPDKYDEYMAALDKENLDKAGTKKTDKAQDILSPANTETDTEALSKIRELSTIYGFTNILGLEPTRSASKDDDEDRDEIKKQRKDGSPHADNTDSKDVKADDVTPDQVDKIIGVSK